MKKVLFLMFLPFLLLGTISVNAGTDPPIVFLRQPGFLWLGNSAEITDTLGFDRDR
jgi:hypothetical protein